MNITNYIETILKNTDFFEGELKVGFLRNDIFTYNINDNTFYGFKNFISKNNKSIEVKHKMYQYYDMVMISKDENSHVCFKSTPDHMQYYSPFKNKLSLRFKQNNKNIIDNLNFPYLEKYHNYEEHDIERFSINYRNSIINIDFININDDNKSIIFRFKVESSNYDNFKKNLEYILTKFYRQKIHL